MEWLWNLDGNIEGSKGADKVGNNVEESKEADKDWCKQ